VEAQGVAVEGERAVEVGDLEVNVSDAHGGSVPGRVPRDIGGGP
jgi:hypothetical protein